MMGARIRPSPEEIPWNFIKQHLNLMIDFRPGNNFTLYYIFRLLSLRAFPTTEMEERLIAAAAMIGLRRMPKLG